MKRNSNKLNVLVFMALTGSCFGQGECPPAPGVVEVAGSPFTFTPGEPFSISFNNTGSLLAVVNAIASDTITMFTVRFDGTLTELGETPIGVAGNADIDFNNDGTLLATVSSSVDLVSVFSVDADGNLALVDTAAIPAGSMARQINFSPDGSLLATSNSVPDNVTVFTVAADGTLTKVGDFSTLPGATPVGLAFSPDGKFLATGNSTLLITNAVTVFSVAADGTLTQIAGSPFAGSKTLFDLEYTPDGKFLIALDQVGFINTFSVDASDGSLTFLSEFTVPGIPIPRAISLGISPDSKLLAIGNAEAADSILIYCIEDSGDLTLIGTFSTTFVRGTEFTPGGTFLAAAIGNAGDAIGMYKVIKEENLPISLNEALIEKYGRGKICGTI